MATAASTPSPAHPRARIGRIPIRDLAPAQPEERWPAKAFRGEVVPFEATAFREGHGELGVDLVLVDPEGRQQTHRMRSVAPGTDRWRADVRLDAEGTWLWRVKAWTDDWATWLHNAEIKVAAGQDLELVFAMGAELLAGRTAKACVEARATLLNTSLAPEERLAAAREPRLTRLIRTRPIAWLSSVSEQKPLRVERDRAAVGSWYEFFPRSEGATRRGDGSWTSGTFRTASARLAAVAAMGFDVVYLPPIHPIGVAHRKGPNNSTTAGPNDPGSPWAIGGPLADGTPGGHDAIHPDLGTAKDFAAFVAEADRLGLEIALDLALQCSPDHPWVTEHPDWFTTRPDGSIAYAENPPKKYQDIYPINFDNDPAGIRAEVLRVVRHWIQQGVRIFRVDNPHTKPLQFWEWLIATVNAEEPDVVFLAEAFTRPAPLQGLAKAGFQQSYTYFTWRNEKAELEEFLGGLAHETADFLRPNLFVNTPDILTEFLQFGGRPAYAIRAAIAATAAPVYGVYAGYEHFENVARPGSEENIDNEKYEYKIRDWEGAVETGDSLAPFLTRLNEIRRGHPALRQLRNFSAHWSDDDSVLVYSKHLDAALSPDGVADTIIVVVNVDPHSVRETTVHLDTRIWGIAPGDAYEVEDLVTGARWTWTDHNYVRLDAFTQPVHILHVKEAR